MSEELKKCPFCGADSDISVQDYDTEDPYYVVACTNCNMAHSSSDDENVAIRNWNDRPIEDAQAARIAELEAERDRLRKALRGLMQAVDGCLTPNEALLWKNCEEALKGSEIGQRGGKTHWLVFMKEGERE